MKIKRSSKIIVGICLVAVLALGMLLMNACKGDEMTKIGISQVVTHPALDATREGIIAALADNGYVEGENAVIDYQNSEGDPSLFDTIATKFVGDKVDVIIAIATPNALSAISAAESTDIPVVFSAVTDPTGAGMVTSWDSHPGENVTGVSDMIAVADDIDLITQIVPGVKTIGTLFNDGEANSVFLVAELKKAAEPLGITIIERPVANSADVLAAAQSLVGQVDAIWIGTDNTVVSGLDALIGVCEEEGIPLFPADNESIERGGIAAYGFDYYDIGYQTGEMVAKILDGASAADIAVERGKVIALTVNTAAAERYGVTIPQDLIDAAGTVFEE